MKKEVKSRSNTEFEMNDSGWFRIRVGDTWSEWTSYECIAKLDVKFQTEHHYFAVSQYYAGYFPCEQVIEYTIAK